MVIGLVRIPFHILDPNTPLWLDSDPTGQELRFELYSILAGFVVQVARAPGAGLWPTGDLNSRVVEHTRQVGAQ